MYMDLFLRATAVSDVMYGLALVKPQARSHLDWATEEGFSRGAGLLKLIHFSIMAISSLK